MASSSDIVDQVKLAQLSVLADSPFSLNQNGETPYEYGVAIGIQDPTKSANSAIKNDEMIAVMKRKAIADTMGTSMNQFLMNRQAGHEKRSFYNVPFKYIPLKLTPDVDDEQSVSSSSRSRDE